MEETKKTFKPFNEITTELLRYSTNESILWSKIYGLQWYMLEHTYSGFNNKDENLAFKDAGWGLHMTFKNSETVSVLLASQSNDEIVSCLGAGEGFLSLKKLSYAQAYDYMYLTHLSVYKEKTWERLTWKWNTNTQQIIADYLDLLSGGLTTLLPGHFNAWNTNEHLRDARPNLEPSEEKIQKSLDDINAKINLKNIMENENLGTYFDNF